MRKSKFTPEQILKALRQAESGTTVVDICRKLGGAAPGTDLHAQSEIRAGRPERRHCAGRAIRGCVARQLTPVLRS